MADQRLILLDRDGVLNEMVLDPELGTTDSPLHPDQVVVPEWVPLAVAKLTRAGWLLSIVTNQPAWAKGRTTRENLEATHARVLDLVQTKGGVINSWFMCLHRSEDNCNCRKPKPKMLLDAIARHSVTPANAWMIGDRLSDVGAGRAAGVKTCLLGPQRAKMGRIFGEGRFPDYQCNSLDDFVRHLLSE